MIRLYRMDVTTHSDLTLRLLAADSANLSLSCATSMGR